MRFKGQSREVSFGQVQTSCSIHILFILILIFNFILNEFKINVPLHVNMTTDMVMTVMC